MADVSELRELLGKATPWFKGVIRNWGRDGHTRASLLLSSDSDDAVLALTALSSLPSLLDRLEAAERRAEKAERAWNAGYLAGFNVSGEGWNGEYPFEGRDPEADPHWRETRDDRRSAFLTRIEGENP